MTTRRSATIKYANTEMSILTPYDAEYVAALKEGTKSRRWNKQNKEWILSVAEREAALSITRQFFEVLEDNQPFGKPPEVSTLPPTCNSMPALATGTPIEAWIDGACEPVNPGGTASYGLVIKQSGQTIAKKCGVVGSGSRMSNNVAEYGGLIALLDWCKTNDIKIDIVVHSDSNMLVRQMSRRGPSTKAKGLYVPYLRRAWSLLSELGPDRFRFEWIPREENGEADALSKQAAGTGEEV